MASPLDTTSFEQDPCSILTKSQADQLGISAEIKPGGTQGPTCHWGDDTAQTLVSAGFVVKQLYGLGGIYKRHEQDPSGTFPPVPDVSGFPGVFADPGKKQPGQCTLIVGLTDERIIQFDAALGPGSPKYSEACKFVQQTAEAAVTTMKGAA